MQSENTIKSVKVQAGVTWNLSTARVARIIRQGERHAEGFYMAKRAMPHIKKLDKDHYAIVNSKEREGEICEYKHSGEKDKKNVIVSHAELRRRIRTNFDGEFGRQVFLTLTYQNNMQDPEQLYRDWMVYWKRVKRSLLEHELDYITVAEPQGRGAWHLHILIKSDKPIVFGTVEKPFYSWSYKWLRDSWREVIGGGGSAEIEPLYMNGDKDIGTYLGSYFSSFESPEGEAKDKNGKRYKKNARLSMYPPHFKFWRCSQGIQKTVITPLSYDDALEEFGYIKHRTDVELTDAETGEVINNISRIHYQKPLEEEKP